MPRNSCSTRSPWAISIVVLAASLLILGLGPAAPLPPIATADAAWGLWTASFHAPEGTIRVNLPDDASAGDTISGTVIEEPEGKTDEERNRNADVLRGMVIELDGQKVPVTGKVLKWAIPASLAGRSATLVLLSAQGKQLSRLGVPVRSAPAAVRAGTPGPGDFQFQRVGQAGKPLEVRGPFDGDFANAGLKLDGRELEKLAESPRKFVGQIPRDSSGLAQLELREGTVTAQSKFNVVRLTMTAGKTTILKGEHTTVRARIEGLQGLEPDRFPIPVEVANESPQVIHFEGEPQQVVHRLVARSAVDAQGNYEFTLPVEGLRAGAFTVRGFLNAALVCNPALVCSLTMYCNAKSDGSCDSAGYICYMKKDEPCPHCRAGVHPCRCGRPGCKCPFKGCEC